ncbi:MAG: hypothetical protein ABFD18_16670, partial [Syntrophomonas sp.]
AAKQKVRRHTLTGLNQGLLESLALHFFVQSVIYTELIDALINMLKARLRAQGDDQSESLRYCKKPLDQRTQVRLNRRFFTMP